MPNDLFKKITQIWQNKFRDQPLVMRCAAKVGQLFANF